MFVTEVLAQSAGAVAQAGPADILIQFLPLFVIVVIVWGAIRLSRSRGARDESLSNVDKGGQSKVDSGKSSSAYVPLVGIGVLTIVVCMFMFKSISAFGVTCIYVGNDPSPGDCVRPELYYGLWVLGGALILIGIVAYLFRFSIGRRQ